MKYSGKQLRITILPVILLTCTFNIYAQNPIEFGTIAILKDITPTSGQKEGTALKWVNVNTDENTWCKQKGILICSGRPIGVMRSEKEYENFILHIEWKHIEPGACGRSIWSGRSGRQHRHLYEWLGRAESGAEP